MKKWIPLFVSTAMLLGTVPALAYFKLTVCSVILGITNSPMPMPQAYESVIVGRDKIETFLKKYEERKQFLAQRLGEQKHKKDLGNVLVFNLPLTAFVESLAAYTFYTSAYFAHRNAMASSRETAAFGVLIALSGIALSGDMPIHYYKAQDHTFDKTLETIKTVITSNLPIEPISEEIKVVWSEKAYGQCALCAEDVGEIHNQLQGQLLSYYDRFFRGLNRGQVESPRIETAIQLYMTFIRDFRLTVSVRNRFLDKTQR